MVKLLLEYFISPRDRLWGSKNTGTKLVGDHLSYGTKVFGTICPWGTNFKGTICQRGSILWGSFVQGDRKLGDRKSEDQMSSGPNESQPSLILWQISNSIGGRAHNANHIANCPSYFQTFLQPFELLLAWFVDVAIQFVMLSQYGRGWSVIMHMYYSSNSPLRYLHLGNPFIVVHWVFSCVECFQPLPMKTAWL